MAAGSLSRKEHSLKEAAQEAARLLAQGGGASFRLQVALGIRVLPPDRWTRLRPPTKPTTHRVSRAACPRGAARVRAPRQRQRRARRAVASRGDPSREPDLDDPPLRGQVSRTVVLTSPMHVAVCTSVGTSLTEQKSQATARSLQGPPRSAEQSSHGQRQPIERHGQANGRSRLR
jgi:hypothetical protein